MKQIEQLLYEGIVNEMNQSHRVQFKYLMIFRLFASFFMTYALIQVSVVAPTFSQNFLYLTLWGGYTTYFYFGLVSIENVSFYKFNKQFFDQSLWKLCHILFIVAFCFELPIMVIYWSYIFPQENGLTINSWLINIDVHSISCILIFVDFILNDIQFQLKQSIVLIVIAIIYLIVNMFYVLVTGIQIYPGINWRNGISYIISVITLGIMFGVFQLGLLYQNKIKKPLMMNKKEKQLMPE
ncbi:unnamed protein product [Paramecium pentaurelia]|uniref:Transmembrane protein n=1 Tax=Paramecium pentaurelia TaxID=43138 RepID=A0A8S1VGZ9_9CILI|nr:unnamed protein product [Paramecium pentaurelia]